MLGVVKGFHKYPMRKWIDIINEKWFNTVVVYDGQVDLFKNPSRAEWAKLFKQFPRGLRGHILTDGSLIVWDAYHATHGDVGDHLGSIYNGYRYFYTDYIAFNDLNMERNENGTTPYYDVYVTRTYTSTVANKSITDFYGAEPRIIGIDTEQTPSRFPITAEWIKQNCVLES